MTEVREPSRIKTNGVGFLTERVCATQPDGKDAGTVSWRFSKGNGAGRYTVGVLPLATERIRPRYFSVSSPFE